jgi:hypothetical protein
MSKTNDAPSPTPAGLTDGEVERPLYSEAERLARIGYEAERDTYQERYPNMRDPDFDDLDALNRNARIAAASAVATAAEEAAYRRGWNDREADLLASIDRVYGPSSRPPGGSGERSIAEEVLRCAAAWEPDARLIGNVRAADIALLARHVLAAQPPTPAPHRPPPARPPEGGDREPAGLNANPSTISSKLVDGDTPPAGGDGCVDQCDDPRCTVHPPADVAPRPQAARGGEGEERAPYEWRCPGCGTDGEHLACDGVGTDCGRDEFAHCPAASCSACGYRGPVPGDRPPTTLHPLADEIECMMFAFGAGDSRRAAVRDLAARVDATLSATVPLADLVAVLGECGRPGMTPELALREVRALAAAHFAAHWPAGGGEG